MTIGLFFASSRPSVRNEAFVGHALQRVVASAHRGIHVDEGALTAGRLNDAGEKRRLLERHILCRLAEVQPRGRLDTVRAMTEEDVVGVEGEDFALGVSLFNLDGDDGLANLALGTDVANLEADRIWQQLRASCCVIVLAPAGRVSAGDQVLSPRSMSRAARTAIAEMFRPKWRSKSPSSAAMIACRSCGAMSS